MIEPNGLSMSDDAFVVVVNDEGQHSIWPAPRPVPRGWREAGFRGTHGDCMTYVDDVWPDITPLSVRIAREAAT